MLPISLIIPGDESETPPHLPFWFFDSKMTAATANFGEVLRVSKKTPIKQQSAADGGVVRQTPVKLNVCLTKSG